ncbi:MAG: putative serpin family protein [Streblomastix strix]|uniref:Putative serpin family protein n=1 Tax=Streblomastix strix TaxID=222440 RepID=A0A5J4WI77_9EUKA|nr:MAG: putative serpin family protein [Streblomastix strix]
MLVKNIVFSPYSIYTALIDAGSGADGQTLDEFRKVLHTYNDIRFNEEKDLLALAGYVAKGKKSRKSSKLYLESNSLWIDSQFNISKEYVNNVKYAVDIDVKELNLHSENARNIVNSYVEKKTKGLIKNILPSINPLVQMDKMMYTRLDDISVVSLPFNLEGIEMMIILPKDKTPEAYQQAAMKYLSAEELRKVEANGNYNIIVHLSLPKFETRFNTQLSEQLKQIGLVNAFTRNATFPKISKVPLKISNVIHEAGVKIDEDGAEAVAVSIFEMEDMGCVDCSQNEEEVDFTVDRPFLFAIYNTHSHMPIFAGMIKTVGDADIKVEMKDDL